MNNAYNRWAVGWIVGNSPGSRAKKFSHPAMISLLKCSCTCQLHDNQVAGLSEPSDVEKPFLFSDLAIKDAKSENKKKTFLREGSD